MTSCEHLVYRVMPSESRSDLASALNPRKTSGAAYRGDPIANPAAVRAGDAADFAIPKSSTLDG
jgi:hypothetical protein